MKDKKAASGGGIGFLGALQILFIALKLLKKIAWSWWWVFSPTWIPLLALFLIIAIIAIVCGID